MKMTHYSWQYILLTLSLSIKLLKCPFIWLKLNLTDQHFVHFYYFYYYQQLFALFFVAGFSQRWVMCLNGFVWFLMNKTSGAGDVCLGLHPKLFCGMDSFHFRWCLAGTGHLCWCMCWNGGHCVTTYHSVVAECASGNIRQKHCFSTSNHQQFILLMMPFIGNGDTDVSLMWIQRQEM